LCPLRSTGVVKEGARGGEGFSLCSLICDVNPFKKRVV